MRGSRPGFWKQYEASQLGVAAACMTHTKRTAVRPAVAHRQLVRLRLPPCPTRGSRLCRRSDDRQPQRSPRISPVDSLPSKKRSDSSCTTTFRSFTSRSPSGGQSIFWRLIMSTLPSRTPFGPMSLYPICVAESLKAISRRSSRWQVLEAFLLSSEGRAERVYEGSFRSRHPDGDSGSAWHRRLLHLRRDSPRFFHGELRRPGHLPLLDVRLRRAVLRSGPVCRASEVDAGFEASFAHR